MDSSAGASCAPRPGPNSTLDGDRFGRSQLDCLHKIEELDRWGVRFLATTQPIDTDQHNPASRLLLHVLGAAAEFEHSLILERTQAGQAGSASGSAPNQTLVRHVRVAIEWYIYSYMPRRCFQPSGVHIALNAVGGDMGTRNALYPRGLPTGLPVHRWSHEQAVSTIQRPSRSFALNLKLEPCAEPAADSMNAFPVLLDSGSGVTGRWEARFRPLKRRAGGGGTRPTFTLRPAKELGIAHATVHRTLKAA